jgi:hypothetical protein
MFRIGIFCASWLVFAAVRADATSLPFVSATDVKLYVYLTDGFTGGTAKSVVTNGLPLHGSLGTYAVGSDQYAELTVGLSAPVTLATSAPSALGAIPVTIVLNQIQFDLPGPGEPPTYAYTSSDDQHYATFATEQMTWTGTVQADFGPVTPFNQHFDAVISTLYVNLSSATTADPPTIALDGSSELFDVPYTSSPIASSLVLHSLLDLSLVHLVFAPEPRGLAFGGMALAALALLARRRALD